MRLSRMFWQSWQTTFVKDNNSNQIYRQNNGAASASRHFCEFGGFFFSFMGMLQLSKLAMKIYDAINIHIIM